MIQPTVGARHMATEATTLCEAFQATAARRGDAPALRRVDGTVALSWDQYATRAERLSAGLRAYGVGRGDTVAIMLTNRPEANLVDTAALHLGAIPFSIYNTSGPAQLAHLIGHARCRLAVTERPFADRLLETARAVPTLEHVFVVDSAPTGAHDFSELEEAVPAVNGRSPEVSPDDVATVIYTSGTTGPPKGVELTHRHILHELRLLLDVFRPSADGRIMSYLPMAHVADRMLGHYLAMVTGASIACAPSVAAALHALPQVRPTVFAGVPAVWEKLKASLESRFPIHRDSSGLQVQHLPVDPGLLAEVHAHLGLDAAEVLLSGAAPIASEVLEFFMALGLPVQEGWGMTECSGFVTCNRPGRVRLGTVGQPLPGIEVTRADDGELLVRGPIVMRGYRSDREATAGAIDAQGWLHTGDIGEIDAEGFVTIVDRKKDLIVNSYGKNMSPANIEVMVKRSCALVGHVVAIGNERPCNTALIVLEPEAAASYAATRGFMNCSIAELAVLPVVREEVAAGIERANAQLSRVEQIRNHMILADQWPPGGDELTPTMKLKRRAISAKYAAVIERLYAPPALATR